MLTVDNLLISAGIVDITIALEVKRCHSESQLHTIEKESD